MKTLSVLHETKKILDVFSGSVGVSSRGKQTEQGEAPAQQCGFAAICEVRRVCGGQESWVGPR
jgi:hypothetical protein